MVRTICTCTSDHTRILQSAENLSRPTEWVTRRVFRLRRGAVVRTCDDRRDGVLRKGNAICESRSSKAHAISATKIFWLFEVDTSPRRCAEHAKQRSRTRAKVNVRRHGPCVSYGAMIGHMWTCRVEWRASILQRLVHHASHARSHVYHVAQHSDKAASEELYPSMGDACCQRK